MAVRCIQCRASPVTLALIAALIASRAQAATVLGEERVLELSSRGALVRFLRKTGCALTTCEYFDDVTLGLYKGETQCQDVQQLTYADDSFDICTSTEVFEHVPSDRAGFREVFRVLRPGGLIAFTVPISEKPVTVERAEVGAHGITHFLPPEYHGDRLRGAGKVLCFRNYGLDIQTRLNQAGFVAVALPLITHPDWFNFGRRVILGTKPKLT